MNSGERGVRCGYLVRLFFPFVGYDSSMNVQFAHLLDLVHLKQM